MALHQLCKEYNFIAGCATHQPAGNFGPLWSKVPCCVSAGGCNLSSDHRGPKFQGNPTSDHRGPKFQKKTTSDHRGPKFQEKTTSDHHGPKFRSIEGRNDAALEYRTLSEEYLEIGERIRRRRLELHLSQEQLAERAGISINTLSRLECGQSSTSINKFRRILLALDADANYLIGLEVSKVKEAGGDEQVFLRFRHLEDEDQKVVAKTMIALLNALEEREK